MTWQTTEQKIFDNRLDIYALPLRRFSSTRQTAGWMIFESILAKKWRHTPATAHNSSFDETGIGLENRIATSRDTQSKIFAIGTHEPPQDPNDRQDEHGDHEEEAPATFTAAASCPHRTSVSKIFVLQSSPPDCQ
jgi:hypothetical protein